MIGKIFAIADTHFNHRNIISYCNRPYTSVEQMNKTLIDNWNKVVGDDDVVIFGGDFSMSAGSNFYERDVKEIYGQLKGKKICLRGNHDTKNAWLDYHKTEDMMVRHGDSLLYFRHHPPATEQEYWKGRERNSIFIYGHVHQKTLPYANTFNMSVENINYTPILLDDIISMVARGQRSVKIEDTFFME